MIFENNIKNITVFATCALMFSTLSCQHVFENRNMYNTDKAISNRNVLDANKRNAKLLVIASQNSLDIIGLCQSIEEAESEKAIEKLVMDLEKTQLEIFTVYKALAQNKMISVPKYPIAIDCNINDEVGFVENNLSLIIEKIKKQIQVLDTLSNTANSDFSRLSRTINPILKSKLAETQNTIGTLKA
ncbi:hypothetical protein ACFFU9_11735 [Mariniflexile ostreae]|uniref:DUF4142 domain-containing protein n=1 Tax=Mariniflexile ostreae TaxID=1520892 RepID=A0ABV5FDB6_9FLAO